MTTDSVHHTFTTTIASPPLPDRRGLVPSTSRSTSTRSRPLRRASAAGGDVTSNERDGTRRRISRSIARGEEKTTDDGFGFGVDVSTTRTSPTTAFERIRARHVSRAFSRAFVGRARAFVARDENGGDSASREVVFERESEGETRAR